jgi:WD40 repeat protein
MGRSLAFLLCFFLVAGTQDRHRLVFSQKIGTDWTYGSGWMNFVAISSDGTTVAANGNLAGNTTGGLGLWTFPGGEFLRSVAGSPLAISPDFRYLATDKDVLDLRNGKTIFPIPHEFYAGAFSPSGEYVALRGASKGRHTQITVLRTADGSTVASFGTRYVSAVAFHPDNRTLASGHWNNVTLWDARTGVRLALLMSPRRPPDPKGYNRDGRYIYGLAFSRDGTHAGRGVR